MVWLTWTFLLLITIKESVSQAVHCYSNFNDGICVNLLGEVNKDDCCMNPHNGYLGKDETGCRSCGAASWSEWSAWGRCSVRCLEGVSQRRRECYGIGKCPDPDNLTKLQAKHCIESDCCPVQGLWGEWGEWQPCSATCEKGTRKRVRSCIGALCGGGCDGSSEEIEPCVEADVCPTHGGWSNWDNWQPCSETCAREGSNKPTKQRYRSCTNPQPSVEPVGSPCPGSNNELVPCEDLPFCPVDGNWGEWSPPGPCSVTCGVGIREMRRECDDPAPKHGGQFCSGEKTQTSICNTLKHCPVDGQWTQWESWEECKSNRGNINCLKRGGLQRRKRGCLHWAHGGVLCEGNQTDYRSCYDVRNCPFQGEGSEWSEWGLCLPPCGEKSERTRVRKCMPDLSEYPKQIRGYRGVRLEDAAFYGTPKVLCPDLIEKSESLPCQNVPPCIKT